MLTFLAASIVAAGQSTTRTPAHVWDGYGPVWCADRAHVRLSGVAARAVDGTCRMNQPCPDGSPADARDAPVRLLGGGHSRNSTGHVAVEDPKLPAGPKVGQPETGPQPCIDRQRRMASRAP